MPVAFPAPDPETADRKAAQAVQSAAQTLIGAMRVAQALVGCHRAVDLTGLDSAVGVLCAQLLDLAPEDARALCLKLIELRGEVDLLTAALERAAAA